MQNKKRRNKSSQLRHEEKLQPLENTACIHTKHQAQSELNKIVLSSNPSGTWAKGWKEGNTSELWFKMSWNPSWPAGSEFLTRHPALTQNRKLDPNCRFLFIEQTLLPTSFGARVYPSWSLGTIPLTRHKRKRTWALFPKHDPAVLRKANKRPRAFLYSPCQGIQNALKGLKPAGSSLASSFSPSKLGQHERTATWAKKCLPGLEAKLEISCVMQ